MLSRRATRRLLDALCTELGFCLPPDAREALCDHPPEPPRAFADAVIVAEGMDPATIDSGLYRRVQALITAAFDEEMAVRAQLTTDPSDVLFEVEHIPRARPQHLVCRQLDDHDFSASSATLDGYRLSSVLAQPRALDASGAQRRDLFVFHLADPADVRAFEVGRIVVLRQDAGSAVVPAR